MCPVKNFSYFLNSSFAGSVTNFLELSVKRCNQSALNIKHKGAKRCSIDPIMLDRVTSRLKLRLLVQTSHFKDDDFSESPIKDTLKSFYLTSVRKQSSYYFMKLS